MEYKSSIRKKLSSSLFRLVPLVLLWAGPSEAWGFGPNYGKCERITIPVCMDSPYNMTRMPNLLGHQSQQDAAMEITAFIPLIEVRCSRLLKFFLCSLFAPMCTEQVNEVLTIPVCRGLCEEVRSNCEPILTRFDFQWPEMLSCDKLPYKGEELCMDPPAGAGKPDHEDQDFETHNKNLIDIIDYIRGEKATEPNSTPTTTTVKSAATVICPERFVHAEKLQRTNTCVPRCHVDVYFTQEDKKFANIWMLIWASLCLFATILTILTFALDTSRFKYPERPVIFLAICYALYSLAFLFRSALGPSAISCDKNQDGSEYIIQEGMESTWCIVIFLILYYFGMAGSLWWVVLTFTWYLAAGRKWGREAIQRLSSYFHVVAWAIPALMTIVALVMRRVDGEELMGMCYVGNQDRKSLIGFVLVPLVVCLVVGTAFIIAGFVAMLRIRNDLRLEGANIRKLEKLMAKIGVFSVLYTVPATCVIGCLFYEQMNMDTWQQTAMKEPCTLKTDAKEGYTTDCSLTSSIPTLEVYLLKIFMSLVVGTCTAMWICSSKTIHTWGELCGKACHKEPTKKRNSPIYQSPASSLLHSHHTPAKPVHFHKLPTRPPEQSRLYSMYN